MNTRHRIASLGFALLLFALLAPLPASAGQAGASQAQAPSDGAFLPEGIEATGDTAEVRALTQWTEEHWQTDPNQTQQAAERALSLARDLDDQRGIGQSLMLLGSLSFSSDIRRAEAYYTAAQPFLTQAEDTHWLFRIQANLGNVYRSRGELERALSAYFVALEGFKRLDAPRLQVSVLNNIGITHKNQGNTEEALAYSERAVALAEALNEPEALTISLNNLSTVLLQQGSYERAEVYLRRALAISREQGFRRHTAAISNNLGFHFNRKGKYEQALPFLFATERIGRELGDNEILFAVTDELGKAYMGLGRYDRALLYADESLTLARESGLHSRQMEAHQTLSQIYKAVGDYEQALVHHEHYVTARDSVLSAEKAEIITEMQTRYETEEKQRDIERLEQENQLQALRASRRQTVLLGGILVALLVAGLFYYRYRAKRKASRLLEELDAAKSRFFANISHEFRTPLTVILGGLQDTIAGRFGNVSGKLADQQRAMLRSSRRLHRLIDEMLDLNRLESGKLELKPTPGDLVQSLQRIVEANAPLSERNGISLTFKHEVENCPRIFDEEKLEKIVGNLLSNALKFTPRGKSVHVSLRCGEGVAISVIDTGPGIPAETRDKIFERFAQLEGSRLKGGTGIGLALAKELTELHGGTITLDSTPGEGSTFTVRLPLEEAVLPDTPTRRLSGVEAEAEPPPITESAPPEDFALGGDGLSRKPVVANDDDVSPDLSRRPAEAKPSEAGSETKPEAEPDRTTVLIIEDNDDVRAFILRSLEEAYRVLEAADGEAGLQQARAELPDLIVSDVMLPGIDGYEVARRLKAEADTECIPVVMLTARAAKEDHAEGYGSGAEVYITKPFSPETLCAAISRLIEERRRLQKRLRKETEQADSKEFRNGFPSLADRARSTVLENLYDENFGVEELAQALGMSRRTLYRRLKPEVGLFPSDFVRTLRLERARKLLSNEAGAVSEVAYAVGFRSLSRFSHCFREHYGEPPSCVLESE